MPASGLERTYSGAWAAIAAGASARTIASAAHKISGSTIKAHSITAVQLKSNTVTGKQIKESTLGTVPNGGGWFGC